MSHLCNRRVRELLILARTWFAFGLPSKPGVTLRDVAEYFGVGFSVGETPDEEVPLLVQWVHRLRLDSIPLFPR
jgi:hypothetical protein